MLERPRRADHLEIRTIGSDVFVNDTVKGQIHVFNLTAGMMLEACDGKNGIDDIVAIVVGATGADSALVRRDVVGIVEKFAEIGILANDPIEPAEASDR